MIRGSKSFVRDTDFGPRIALGITGVVEGAAAMIRRGLSRAPRVAIVLGSGLGELAAHIDQEQAIPYERIPHFPRSTALGHHGQLVCGTLQGVPVAVLSGRCHFYEGYRFDEVTLPVQVLATLGARWLIVSNASGGLNPLYNAGELMLISDHIDLLGARTASIGRGQTVSATSRASSSIYDRELIELAAEASRREDIVAHRGVYVAVTGPCYETRAEYRAFRRIGGDAVGMSTIPEVIAARRAGMRVLGISTITNVAQPDVYQRTDAWQVVDVASHAEPKLRRIVEWVLQAIRLRAGGAP